MKKYILLIPFFFFIGISQSSAQQLLEVGNNWNLLESIWQSSRTANYSIGSDTIVNGLTYKRVLRNGVPASNQELLAPSIIRETEDGKVYADNHLYGDTDEILIYDFGLEIMDTFTLAPSLQSNLENKFVVTVIDTVVLLNGDLRRQFTLELLDPQFNVTLNWIEGIGDIQYGPFYYQRFYVFDAGTDLLCANQEETLAYQNSQYDSCFVTITSIQEFGATNPIKIYPNPVHDQLTLEFSAADYSFTEIRIFNATGSSVYQQKNPFNAKEINTSELTPGMYYIILKEKSGTHFSKKIIKQ